MFSGESESWDGKYNANIDGSSEVGEYVFGYKDAKKDMVIENLKIIIKNGLGETSLNESKYKGATIKIPSSCGGCAVTDTKTSIQVTIEWGEESKETFSMESYK